MFILTILGLAFGAGNFAVGVAPYLSKEVKPWSPQWYQLCSEHFKSFDARTGLWVDLNGKKHFCRFVNVRK
jgi:hypothetical protein